MQDIEIQVPKVAEAINSGQTEACRECPYQLAPSSDRRRAGCRPITKSVHPRQVCSSNEELPTGKLHEPNTWPTKLTMKIKPPPDRQRSSEPLQLPVSTNPAILEASRAAFDTNDIKQFRCLLKSSTSVDICDFYALMKDAIRQGKTIFIQELLRCGLPLAQEYVLGAVKEMNMAALEVFCRSEGWDVNEPKSTCEPAVLG